MANKLSIKGDNNKSIQFGNGNNNTVIEGNGNITKQTNPSDKNNKSKNSNWAMYNFFLNSLNFIKNCGLVKWITGLF